MLIRTDADGGGGGASRTISTAGGNVLGDLPRDRVGKFEAPWISTGWDNRSEAEHVLLDRSMSLAWDALCEDPEWRLYHQQLEPRMRPPDSFCSIVIGDGITSTRSRKGKDGLFVYASIEAFRDETDKVAFMTDLFRFFFDRYAKAFDLPRPPEVGRQTS